MGDDQLPRRTNGNLAQDLFQEEDPPSGESSDVHAADEFGKVLTIVKDVDIFAPPSPGDVKEDDALAWRPFPQLTRPKGPVFTQPSIKQTEPEQPAPVSRRPSDIFTMNEDKDTHRDDAAELKSTYQPASPIVSGPIPLNIGAKKIPSW